jgi:FkbM family methyltransferase
MAALFAKSVLGDEREQELIGAFLGDAPGTFVEVGANEPILLSQTHHLERRGWDGILIEPLREYAERLRSGRRARVFQVAAGAPEDEGKTLPLQVAGALSTLASSIVEDVRPSEIRHVSVRTLDSILAEAGLNRVDFLSIDV